MSKSENKVASYAIIGFGNIGKALAKAFARNGIDKGNRLSARWIFW